MVGPQFDEIKRKQEEMRKAKEAAEKQKKDMEARKKEAAEAARKQRLDLQRPKQEPEEAVKKPGTDRWQELMKERQAAKQMIAEHVVGEDDTLSHIALKYYKNAAKPYWMVIFEANKEVIGDNPNIIVPGMKLRIPPLPEALKK